MGGDDEGIGFGRWLDETMRDPLAMMIAVVFVGPWLGLAADVWAADERRATPAESIRVREGFAVELVYSVPRDQGSWVAMCFDDRGRIYASDQGARLFRVTPPGLTGGNADTAVVTVVSDQWGNSQGLAYINKALYVIQHGDRSEPRLRPDALLKISDADGDDHLDTEERLIEFPRVEGDAENWVEHSYHAVIPGPDGESLYIVSGDRNGLPCDKGLVPPHWNRDSWDFEYTPQPYSGGCVIRTDLNGKNAEYICMGLRNSYDIAFNHDGDLFTYDSDLENDFGLPNYRPTAIRQVVSGTDCGWGGRAGEMLWSWSADWEDIQPPIRNIGPGSPTGICFGYGARFPAQYQRALFACDWSYGRMFAVHLTPVGAGYSADPEPFLSAQGLPVADVCVSPEDGCLYFLTGGRGTQSAIYRVTYVGTEDTATASALPLNADIDNARQLRRQLESFHGRQDSRAVDFLWAHLASDDRAIRNAARAALEWQPVAEWRQLALRETNSRTALQALLSLARSTDGDSEVQAQILAALDRVHVLELSAEEQSWYLRILTISARRHGLYDKQTSSQICAKFLPLLPSNDRRVNREVVALCAALDCGTIIEPALGLLQNSRTQEDQVVYCEALIRDNLSTFWTPELREQFFRLVMELVPHWKGGFTARSRREHILNKAVQMLTESERQRFAELIAASRKPVSVIPATQRALVRKWTLDDLTGTLDAKLADPRNIENGRRLFSAVSCIVCHSFQGEGGLGGPDLTSVAGRYTARDLLENILEPSRVINEQYGLQIYQMKDGSTYTGRTVNMAGDTVMITTNPNDPGGSEIRFSIHDLEASTPTRVSFMPEGLLNTLTHDEILDLLAYLRSSQ